MLVENKRTVDLRTAGIAVIDSFVFSAFHSPLRESLFSQLALSWFDSSKHTITKPTQASLGTYSSNSNSPPKFLETRPTSPLAFSQAPESTA